MDFMIVNDRFVPVYDAMFSYRGKRFYLGHVFGRLTVVGPGVGNGKCRIVPCVCSCGNEIRVNKHDLVRNRVRSCGCLRADVSREQMTKMMVARHGLKRKLRR